MGRQFIAKDAVTKAREALKGTKAKVDVKVTKTAAVRRLEPEIRRLRSKGYSFQDIAEILKQAEIEISPDSLKSALQRAKKLKPKQAVAKGLAAKTASGVSSAVVPAATKEGPGSNGRFVPVADRRA
ncbi:hypothetical protein CHU93_16745 [Sandarakinorhabdus cyanobacteriorum]|uniref:Uncharacterized protein n=1 Tax=Sandarakinorhabdus cyanobacteriorum TaxID=1981098 RepID=A0A255Y3V5_9SPHN|nr:hypothetical protein [Sandarakinorhabdus cyanobacteriorum]OYQ23898.1 hypothetical protein CHU93_16745 [Sandarakinorhabdus cyanobacteriorum]